MIFSFLHLYWKESSLQKKKVDGEGEVVALCNSEPIAEFYLGGGINFNKQFNAPNPHWVLNISQALLVDEKQR